MNIDGLVFGCPEKKNIPELKELFRKTFGDSEEFLTAFFTLAFSEKRAAAVFHLGKPVSALYWFDCFLKGKKIAYIYAVATDKEYRGRKIGSHLLTETHNLLTERGYTGAILVPVNEGLFGFYGKFGYEKSTSVKEFCQLPRENSGPLIEITKEKYARERKKYLPEGAIVQEGENLEFLGYYNRFYLGEDFICTVSKDKDKLICPEILGNEGRACEVLYALGAKEGVFRTVGNGRVFTMYKSLNGETTRPTYFAFAFD